MIQLDYRDARPIYSQILDGFREQILTGVLQPGDRMPSIRELATQLTINPNTIQRAYRELETGGWIASVPGKGSFVCIPPGMSDRLLREFDAITAKLLAQGFSTRELAQRITQGGNDHA